MMSLVMFFSIEFVCISPPPALLFSGEPKGVDARREYSHTNCWLVSVLSFPFAFGSPDTSIFYTSCCALWRRSCTLESADLGDEDQKHATPRATPHPRCALVMALRCEFVVIQPAAIGYP